jgi:hypothetical protein
MWSSLATGALVFEKECPKVYDFLFFSLLVFAVAMVECIEDSFAVSSPFFFEAFVLVLKTELRFCLVFCNLPSSGLDPELELLEEDPTVLV